MDGQQQQEQQQQQHQALDQAEFNAQQAYAQLAGMMLQLQQTLHNLTLQQSQERERREMTLPEPVPAYTNVIPGDADRGYRLKQAGIKLPLPPKFSKPDKTLNSKQWLRLVQHYCLQFALDNNDAIAIATSLLQEPAATWWLNLVQQIQAGLAAPILDWQDWQVRFLQAFPTGDLPWLARAKLIRPQVVQNGSVQDYLTRLTTFFLEAGPTLSEDDKRFLFWAGCKQPIKDKLDLNSNMSLAEMTQIALEYDARWRISQQITNGFGQLSPGASSSGSHTNPTPMELGNVRFKGNCHHCGKPGHKQADCFKLHPEKDPRNKKKNRKWKGKQPTGSSSYKKRQGGRVNNIEVDSSDSSSSSDSESEN